MARTKTRARTFEERWPNGAPSIRLPSKGPIVSNNRIFNDHTGRPALMSWESVGVKRPLPPLASWVFYMVHPDVPHEFDGSAFYSDLEYDHSTYHGGSFRYEFLFLPGATAEQCHAHFRGEMEARGTIWRQIHKTEEAMNLKICGNGQEVKDDSDQDPATDSQLPGLVWPSRDPYFQSSELYRGWFFMFPHADIECRSAEQKARDVYLISFDPVDIPDWDTDEEGIPNPMKRPVYSKRMKAKNEEGNEGGLFGWMEMAKSSHWEEEANDATSKALELGWESW